jgi:hypothetical protein
MPLDSLLTLGPFTVDEAGRLAPGSPDRFPAFQVIWRGRKIHVRMARASGAGRLAVEVALGRVPSTGGPSAGRQAEASQTVRASVFAIIAALPHTLPEGWTMRLLPDHTLRLAASLDLDLPSTASELLTGLTVFLLALAPYLDLADEGGLDAGCAGPA